MSEFIVHGTYWLPSALSQRVIAIPNELARFAEHMGYYPVTLQSIEGIRKDIGHFTLDWDNRVEIKCNLAEVYVRTWPEDEFHSPEQLEEIREMNAASMLHTVGVRFGQGKYLTKIGGGANSVYLWTNPIRSEIVRKGGGRFKGGGNGGIDGPAVIASMIRAVQHSSHVDSGTDDSNSSVYSMVEKVRQLLVSEGISQTMIFRGVSGSGKSEAMKAAIQYLLFAEHFATGATASEKVAELTKKAKEATRAQTDSSDLGASGTTESYQCIGTARHPFLMDIPVEGVSASSPAGRVATKTLAGLMIFDYFFSCPTEHTDRSSRCIKTVKFVYNSQPLETSGEGEGEGKLQSVEMAALLIDPNRISTGAKKGSADVFLIFPMMMAGLSNVELSSFGITSTIRSAYIAGVAGKKTEAELASDFKTFRKQLLLAGCDEVCFSEAMQSLACICHLQSVSIIGSDSAQVSSSSLVSMTAVDKVMGLPKGLLSDYLLKNDTGRLGVIDHKPADSRMMLDCLCQSIYYRVVHWLSELTCYKSMVASHNSATPIPADMPLSVGSYHVDFLDIMGWENVDLERCGNLYTLCKNYCNERFQYQFLQLAFNNVVQAYLDDGVMLPNYTSPICPEVDAYTDLFDKLGSGIVSIMEDVTKSMRPEDKSILDKLLASHSKTKMVRMGGQKALKKTDFTVQHSFSTCSYDLDGFSANNARPAHYNRKVKIINEFLNKNTTIATLREESSAEDEEVEVAPAPAARGGRPGARPGAEKGLQVRDFLLTRAKDVLTRFLTHVSGSSGSPRVEGNQAARVHYVLCLLTNPDVSSFKYDGVNMIHQFKHFMLPALGNLHKNLLFSYTFSVSDFFRKYRLCFLFECKALPPLPLVNNAAGEIHDAENMCKILLDACLQQAITLGLADTQEGVDAQYGKGYKENTDNSQCPSAAMFGRTGVYCRSDMAVLLNKILLTKQTVFRDSATKIQTHVRMLRDLKVFKKMRTSSILLSALVRKSQGRAGFVKLKRCATRMRANVLMRKQRVIFLTMKWASNLIKQRLLGTGFFFVRTRYLRLRREIQALHYVIRGRLVRKTTDRILKFIRILQRTAMRFIFKKRWFHKKNKAALLIGRMSRGMVTRRHFSTLVATINAMKKQRIANAVTTKLQLRFRGKKVSNRFRELRRASIVCQGVWRTRLCRRRFLNGRMLILWLQSKARQLIAINRVSFLYAAEMLLQERAKLSVIRDKEIASVHEQMPNANGLNHETSRVLMGSGLLKDDVTHYKSYCIAFNVGSSAITTMFPSGLLSTLNAFQVMLAQHGKQIATASTAKKIANNQLMTSPIKGMSAFTKLNASQAASVSPTKSNRAVLYKEFHMRKMVAGSHHLLLLDDEYNIYGCGIGHGGELGNNSNKSYAAPILLDYLVDKLRKDQHSNLNVHDPLHPGSNSSSSGTLRKKSVSGGLTHVGRGGSDGNSKNSSLSMTHHLNVNVIVREMCCGHEHTLLLSDGGLLWSWGNNWRGQLGHSDFSSSNKPMLVRFKNRDSSKVHLKNKVLGMFGGEAEEIGNSFNQSATHSNANTIVHANNRTKSISCGSYHSACVNDQGYLYTWGASECLGREAPPLVEGQKARGKGSNDTSNPSLVMFFASNKSFGGQKLVVSNLCCGEQHVHCFATPTLRNNTLSTGQAPLYAWGSNKCGQLGIGESKEKLVYRPVRVAGIPAVDLGELKHSHGADLLRAESSDVVSSKGPIIVANMAANYPDAVQLRSCGRHVMLMIAGKLWGWGWNNRGQVGINSKADCWVPTEIKLPLVVNGRTRGQYKSKIKSVAVGWHHSSAVCDDGAVFVWGAPGVLEPAMSEVPTGIDGTHDYLVPTRLPDFAHNSPGFLGEMAAEIESVSCSNFSLVTVKVVDAPPTRTAIPIDPSEDTSTPTKDRSRSMASNSSVSPPHSPGRSSVSASKRPSIQTPRGSVHLGGRSAEHVLSGSKAGYSPPRHSTVHDTADEEGMNQTGTSYGKSPLHGKRPAKIPHEQLSRSRFHDHDRAREHSKYCNDQKWATRDATPFATSYNHEPVGGSNVAKASYRASNWEVHEMFRRHIPTRIRNPRHMPEKSTSEMHQHHLLNENGDVEFKMGDPELDALSMSSCNLDIDSACTSPSTSPFGFSRNGSPGSGSSSSSMPVCLAPEKPVSYKKPKAGRRRRSVKEDPKSAAALKRALSIEGILQFFEPAKKKDIDMGGKTPDQLKEEERAAALSFFGDMSDEDYEGTRMDDDFDENSSPLSKTFIGKNSVSGHGVRAPSIGGGGGGGAARRSSLSDNYSAFATYTMPVEKANNDAPEDEYLALLKKEMNQNSYFSYDTANTSRQGLESFQARARTRTSPGKTGSPNRIHISSVRDLQLQIHSMKNDE